MAETRIECPNKPCLCDKPRLIGKNGRTYHDEPRTDQTAQGEAGKWECWTLATIISPPAPPHDRPCPIRLSIDEEKMCRALGHKLRRRVEV